MNKQQAVGLLSSGLEAYTSSLFAFLIPTLMLQLLPNAAPETMLSIGNFIFWIGLCAFPFGALVFGSMGDYWGRKQALLASSLLLSFATLGMALCPTQFGYYSMAIICVFQVLQYLGSGGEYNGATIYTLEHTDEKTQAEQSALSCTAAAIGLFLASVNATFPSLGSHWWRLGFLVGSFGAILATYLKYRCAESPAFHYQKPPSWHTLLARDTSTMVQVTLLALVFSNLYFLTFLVLPQYDVLYHFELNSLPNLMLCYICVLFCSRYLLLFLKPVFLMFCAIGLGLGIVVLFATGCVDIQILQYALIGATALFAAPIHSFTLSCFPATTRCRALSLCFAIAGALSGTTLQLALFFQGQYQNFIVVFSIGNCVVAIIVIYRLYSQYLKFVKLSRAHSL